MNPTERLRQLIEERGIKQVWLAKEAGVSLYWMHNYLSGKSTKMSAQTAIKLSKILNVSVEYLAGLTDDPTPKREGLS